MNLQETVIHQPKPANSHTRYSQPLTIQKRNKTMSDIIKGAKQLLEGATPGPWRLDDSFDPGYPALHGAPQEENGIIRTPILSDDISDDFDPGDADLIAAAPELAQALAEETWEYTQEIYFNEKWQPIYEDLWFETPEECDGLWLGIEPWKYHDEPTRIVRRRVSPVEVINE